MSPRKLTERQVKSLRSDWRTKPVVSRALSRKYGISRQSMRKIFLGHTYKDIRA
jgi:hypothetical protein